MGSNTSKITETAAQTQKNELDVGDNPDPRSPTPEITRTPLQGKTGAKHNITKNVDLRKTFENGEVKEKLIHNNPILSAVIKNHLQSYDPRSPTQDFERTPIILTSNVDDEKKLQLLTETNCASPNLPNDSIDSCETGIDANNLCYDIAVPKNLLQGFNDLTFDDTIKDNTEPLGSSTASNETIENNISNGYEKKPTKLLETNFDYIDKVYEEIINGENVESENVENVETENVKNVPLFKILNEDPRSPSIGIERTPIVVEKTDEDTSQENVEEMSDDTLIKVLQNTNVELRHTNARDNNSDGLLIYEDDTSSLNETPKKSKSVVNSGSRTPLSCMKNKDAGHNRSKSTNTLYDSKVQNGVPCKVTKRTSQIPRLKSLSKQSKLMPTGSSISLRNISKASGSNGDCENTPPHSHRDRWDKDSSIVL